MALAHRILVIVDPVRTIQAPDQELRATYHDARDRAQIVHRAVERLCRLAYRVTLEPLLAAADTA